MAAQLLESTAGALFHASWQAGILAVVVLIVCRAFSRMPAAARSWLWLIVLARLLFPITPQCSLSLFNVVNCARSNLNSVPIAREISVAHDEEKIEPNVAPLLRDDAVVDSTGDSGAPATVPVTWSSGTVVREFAAEQSPVADVPTSFILTSALAVVWALGAAILFTRSVLSWLRLRRFLAGCRVLGAQGPRAVLEQCRLEMGVKRQVELVVSDAETAPALAGCAFPRIVLSAKTLGAVSPAELAWLFRHELAHVRRWDLAIGRFWSFARALHWFNPLVWWAASRARGDAELACDEWVVKRAAPPEQAAYGQTLLKVAELLTRSTPLTSTVGISLGEAALSRRIRAIADYRRPSRSATFAVASIVMCLAGAGLTDAIQNPAAGADSSANQSAATPNPRPSGRAAPILLSAKAAFGLPAGPDGRPQLAAVLDAWERGRGRLKSYDVYLTFDFATLPAKRDGAPLWTLAHDWRVNPDPRFGVALKLGFTTPWNIVVESSPAILFPSSRQNFSRDVRAGVKLRVEYGVGQPSQKPAEAVSVWDGDLAKSHLPRSKQFSVEGTKSNFPPAGAGYEYLLSSCASGSDMIEVLRKRSATVVERADGAGIVVYTPPPFGYRIWLDPAKNFLPRKIQRLLDWDGTIIVDLMQENTLAEVSAGVWAPVKFAVSLYPRTKESAPSARKPDSQTVVTVNRKHSRFNVPIDESLFQLAIPNGFMVGDDICHRVYEFGKAKTSLTQISQWVLEGKMSAKDYKEFVKRSGVADKLVHGEVRLD